MIELISLELDVPKFILPLFVLGSINSSEAESLQKSVYCSVSCICHHQLLFG